MSSVAFSTATFMRSSLRYTMLLTGTPILGKSTIRFSVLDPSL